MGLHELAGLHICALDVGLELLAFDAPLPASTHLDRRQLAASDQCVGLRRGDVEDLRHVGELQEAGAVHREAVSHCQSTRYRKCPQHRADATGDVANNGTAGSASPTMNLSSSGWMGEGPLTGGASVRAARLATPRWLDARLVLGIL